MDKICKQYLIDATSYQGGRGRPHNAKEMLKLSSNENQLGASPMALRAIAETLPFLHEYPDNDDTRLRNALSDYYHKDLGPDYFFCAPAGSEIIEMICRAFLNPGSEVVVCSPTFSPYRVFSEKMGANVIDVPLKGEDFQIDLEAIVSVFTTETRLLFLANPNNPTGTFFNRDSLSNLLDIIPENVILVYDEVYWHYVDDPTYTTAVQSVLNGKNIIAVNSFSKVFGLAGLRLGFGYGSPTLIGYVRNLEKPFLNSVLAINAGIAALKDRIFLDHSIYVNKVEKLRLYEAFHNLQLKYWWTQANFILVVSPGSAGEFCRFLFNHGVMVREVVVRGIPCARMTIGSADQNKVLLNVIKLFLKNIPTLRRELRLN